MRTHTLVPLALSILALAAPSAALAAAERTVSVEATARLRVPNDSARVGLGVSLTRGSRGAALGAVAAKLKRVIAAVQAVPGIRAGDVGSGRISVSRDGRGRFRAGAGITVTLHEPGRAGRLVQTAIAAGATGVRGPTYFVGDTGAAYGKALAAAFQKARAKATTLAAQAGADLGEVLTIREGGMSEITPFEAKDTPAGAGPARGPAPPTKPGLATVAATVSVVFALQ